MRALFAAAAVLGALAAPAYAQDQVTQETIDAANAAFEAAGLDDEFYKLMWCGGAFTIIQTMLTEQGKTDDANTVEPLRSAIYTKAAQQAIAAGVTEADFTALSEHGRILALSQVQGDADYTQEECTAAAQ